MRLAAPRAWAWPWAGQSVSASSPSWSSTSSCPSCSGVEATRSGSRAKRRGASRVSERLVRIMTGLISLVFFMSVTVFGVWVGAGKLSSKYRLHANFSSAGQGLQSLSDVKIHGINVGQVTSVHLVRGRAQVNMALHSDEKVPVDASATIRPKTLFGEKFVDIDPGRHEAQGPFIKS